MLISTCCVDSALGPLNGQNEEKSEMFMLEALVDLTQEIKVVGVHMIYDIAVGFITSCGTVWTCVVAALLAWLRLIQLS